MRGVSRRVGRDEEGGHVPMPTETTLRGRRLEW